MSLSCSHWHDGMFTIVRTLTPYCDDPSPIHGNTCSPATMSQTSTEAPSRSNYRDIFDSALNAYKKKTGKDLTTDPLLSRFKTCHSPSAILAIFQTQVLGPGQPQSSGDKWLTWLNPTINVLNAFSAVIAASVGQVSLKTLKVTCPGSAA